LYCSWRRQRQHSSPAQNSLWMGGPHRSDG
jgi:hypothetical protein